MCVLLNVQDPRCHAGVVCGLCVIVLECHKGAAVRLAYIVGVIHYDFFCGSKFGKFIDGFIDEDSQVCMDFWEGDLVVRWERC